MNATRLARRVFVSFIITFALARSAAVLMMVGRLGDFYLHFGGTRRRQWVWSVLVPLGVVWFTALMVGPVQRMHRRIAPWFRSRPPAADSIAVDPPRQPPAGPSQRIRK